MRFIIKRNALLQPLQMVIGAIERRQTMPILANVLLVADGKKLSMTCTDLEIELISSVTMDYETDGSGSITVSGRKLLDICRVLPENSMVEFTQESDSRVVVRAEKSRFVLAALPAEEFPNVNWNAEDKVAEFVLSQPKLLSLHDSTQFAMAQQDVRYYLNGLLLELKDGMLWAVATDGHRLALNGIESPVTSADLVQVIVPRKGVIELMRLLANSDQEATVVVGKNHVRVSGAGFVFTSKLIDGKFPDYNKAIPKECDKEVVVNRDLFKNALTRVAVLSNDMFRGVRLQINNGIIRMSTNTQEQEEAEEEIGIEYQGEDIATGFNINYLLDVLSNIESEKVIMKLKDGSSSILIEGAVDKGNNLYVIMPLRF